MKTVLVLGNARSGTSMTAGILNILGVDLHHKINPSRQNPRGGFENHDFNSITGKVHNAFLKNQIDEQEEELTNEIKMYVNEYKREIWGWKSALTHLHLDFFLKEIENPFLVVVTRNLYHNAVSWKVHMSENYGQLVTIEESLQKIAEGQMALIKNVNKQSCPKIWTTYEDIKLKPIEESKRIANFLEIEFTENVEKMIIDFIIPDYSTIKETNG